MPTSFHFKSRSLTFTVACAAWGVFTLANAARADASRNGIVWRNENLTALQLGGTPFEIGQDAVTLSGLRYDESMSAFMNLTFDNTLLALGSWDPLHKFVIGSFDSVYLDPMKERILPLDKDFVSGLAKGFGIDSKKVARSFIIPDAQHVLADIALSELNHMFGCSSIYAAGSHSSDGRRILARNFDYAGAGLFDKNASITLISPDHGFRHFAIAPLGLPTSGISGMNEKGLAFVLHSGLSKNTSKYGVPMLSVNREVIENASNIEEALAIYKKHELQSGWMIHLTDREPGTGLARSAVVEVSSKGVDVLWSHDTLSAQSNYFRTPLQVPDDIYVSEGAFNHDHDRLNRLESLIREKPVDLARSVEILQDSYSPYSQTEVEYSPSAIRVPDQLNSMVFFPDEGRVWVASGLAPSSLNRFYEFSFEQMEKGSAPREFIPRDDEATPAYKTFVEGYRIQSQEHGADSIQKSLNLFVAAHKQAKDCSWALVAATSQIQKLDLPEASKLLNESLACESYSPHQKALANFYKGLLELSGQPSTQNRESANRFFDQAADLSKDPDFLKHVAKIRKKDRVKDKELIKESKIEAKLMDRYFW